MINCQRFAKPLHVIGLLFVMSLQSCGGGGDFAQSDHTSINGTRVGPTPFTAYVDLERVRTTQLNSVTFTIDARRGTFSAPVSARYSIGYLQKAGYAGTPTESLRVPVFGLYPKHTNGIRLELEFVDGSIRTLNTSLTTGDHSGPTQIYSAPVIMTPRAEHGDTDNNFFYIHSGLGTPVVIDSDGYVRWAGVRTASSTSSIWIDNGFVVGAAGPTISRYELDGRSSTTFLTEPRYYQFHHNIDKGRTALFGEFDQVVDGVHHDEFTLAEFDPTSGRVLKEWDFAQIIGDYMNSKGDDPSKFVNRLRDWFHMNSAIYSAPDNSILVSSRENFVIKIDYDTNKIIWILGDPTKYWHTFPSLRAKAVTLKPGDYYPIGQHALSITPENRLQLFNNGFRSVNQPTETPAGDNRNVSVVSTYDIDPITLTGSESQRFNHPSSLYSDICSSAHTNKDGSMLVSYAAVENRTKARVVGINPLGRIMFDYEYPSAIPCQASYRANTISFGSLSFN
jgi:arylsulfate sulfotransferase